MKGGTTLGGQAREADMILLGPTYTVDGPRRWTDGIAITGDRIAGVGIKRDLDELRGPGTEVLEFPDGMIFPAFQDAHIHALEGGLVQLQCDLHDVYGREQYVEAIASYAAGNPDRTWVTGGGWSMDAFPGGTPSKELLDAVVPDRPVFVLNRDGHGAWVNSKALEMAGIDASTPDPSGGRIERNPDGSPQGTLHEHAMDIVEGITPKLTQADREEGLILAQRQLHALGITSWQDARVEEEELAAYTAVNDRGDLTARVVLSLLWRRDLDMSQIDALLDRRARGTRGNLRATTAKIFQDGVVENFTASMLDPYLDEQGRPSGNSGISMLSPEELNSVVTLLDSHGFQVHIHAIGDRAVREGLDACQAALETNGRRDSRHHICHLQVVHPADLRRFRTLGVVANAQPFWACLDPQMKDLTIPFLGPERTGWQYPFASLLAHGAQMAFGSDWPVSTPNPLLEMEVAVTRIDPTARDAEPFIPAERIGVRDAVAAFTTGAAFVNFHEGETGSIESGKKADIAVLDRQLFAPEDDPIGDAQVVLTLAGGEIVHSRLDGH